MRRAIATAALAASITGCGDGETESAAAIPCPPPSRVVGARCLEPGVADDGCPAGTLGLPEGTCRPAGLLAEDCAEGFAHVPFDETPDATSAVAGSCEPILPAEVCPEGRMAVPGETACRPVMDCGSGKWGALPIDAATVHVDQAFAGVSNGSAAAPWTTIGQAVAVAAPDALVAIAAGSYVEDVVLEGAAVRLWGVCPDAVEVVGTGAEIATILVLSGASGSEVRGLAVRGPTIGVALSGSEELLFEQLWVHDNAGRGIDAESTLGPSSCTVRASLIERNHDDGVYVNGAGLTVEATVVRDTQAQQLPGRGISVRADALTSAPATAAVRGSLVERNHEHGVFVVGSIATVEATVVRDTLPDAQGIGGRGIGIQSNFATGAPSTATVMASFVAHNQDLGVFVAGSEATVEATVVRGTLPDPEGLSGRGIGVQPNDQGMPSNAVVRTSLVELNREHGVFVAGSELTVEATVVRGTLSNALGLRGRGISIQANLDTGVPSTAAVRASLIEHNRDAGVYVSGSDATIEGCQIRGTQPNDLGRYGDGVFTVAFAGLPTSAFVASTRIEDSARAGVSSFGATVSLGDSLIRCAAFDFDGEPYPPVELMLEDRGGNLCGCPTADHDCKAVSIGLEPPGQIE